jgi:AhpC/TSA family
MPGSQFIIISFSFLVFSAALPVSSFAQIDFFSTRDQKNQPPARFPQRANINRGKAKTIFFLGAGCQSCPEEASRIEKELSRLGLQYEIEGIFRGDPSQVGKYLAELRSYPFNFEIGLDMDGKLTKQYRVRSFPTAVIEVAGKRIVVTKASELEDKLK